MTFKKEVFERYSKQTKSHQKGQISFFLILAMAIVVLSVLFIFVFSKGFSTSLSPFQSTKNSVQTYVQDCIITTVEEGIHKISIQGGYLEVPNNIKIETFKQNNKTSQTAKLLAYDQSHRPTKESIQRDLNTYINNNIKTCLNEFVSFHEKGIQITTTDPITSTLIREKSVLIDLNMKTTISEKEKTTTISAFKATKENMRIPYILSSLDEIIDYSKENKLGVDTTVLDQLDLDSEITPFTNDTFVYRLTDKKSYLYHNMLQFRFAVSWE